MLTPPMILDTERAKHAADLYNRVHDMLTEHGWKEDLEEDHFWPQGKPTWSWRHPDHPGSWSMDAAMICVAQTLPKRT